MPAAIPTNKNTVIAQGLVPRPLSISQPRPRPAATATTNSKPIRKPTPSALFSARSFFPSPSAVPLRSRRALSRRRPSDVRSSGVLCSPITRHQRPTRPSRQERQNGANHKGRGGGCQGSATPISCGKSAISPEAERYYPFTWSLGFVVPAKALGHAHISEDGCDTCDNRETTRSSHRASFDFAQDEDEFVCHQRFTSS